MKWIIWLLIVTNFLTLGGIAVTYRNAYLRGHLEGCVFGLTSHGGRSLLITQKLKARDADGALAIVNQDISFTVNFLSTERERLQADQRRIYDEMSEYLSVLQSNSSSSIKSNGPVRTRRSGSP